VCMYDDESDARDVQSSSSSRPLLRSPLPRGAPRARAS
jgi:hypothetical protein